MKTFYEPMNILDEVLGSFIPVVSKESESMKTDIVESEKSVDIMVNMAGFSKEQIAIEYEKGYLTISGKKEEKEEKKYLCKERAISCKRSYYVGEIEKSSIKAKFENGVLEVNIPKESKLPEDTHILID